MIAVSNEFKKAIKEPERQIKGYVEILYDMPNIEITPTTNMTSTYTNITEVSNGNRVSNNYGTLDYLPLDGSILVMDTLSNENSGFISDELSGNINNASITLTFNETTIKGITAYYEDNLPENASYTLSDGTTGYFDGEEIQQAIFDGEKTITSITISYDLWRYDDRKIRINQIDLGISQIYKDQDLIEFTIDEEVNKLVLETPINETNITLNNMSDLFNPLNPTGIVPYLSENTLIIPYIGILTENLGVEYVKMGEFFFDNYTNNADSTTTLNGKNIMKSIERKEITDGVVGLTDTFIDLGGETPTNSTTDILNGLGLSCEFNPRQKIGYYLHFLEDISLINFLKNVAMHDFSIVYADRDNKLIIRDPEGQIVDNLTKTELTEDAQYKKIERINTIKRISKKNSSDTETQAGKNLTIFSSQDNAFIMQKETQNFAIKNNIAYDAWMYEAPFTYEGVDNAEIKYGSNNYTFIQATGTIGSIAKFDCVINNKVGTAKVIENTYTVTNKASNEREVILETESTLNAFPGLMETSLGQLEYTPSYEMRFEYNGDPSLEAGDYINVETPYGYKPLFIQKQSLKFDGGLEGSIEGVE